MIRRTLLVAGGSIAIVLAVAACGGGSTHSESARTSTTARAAPTAAAGSANPNTSEVNPAGDIPDTQVYVLYRPAAGGFSVKVPEGWARTEANGSASFTDKLNTIRIETRAQASAPTADTARRDDLPAIESQSHNFQPGQITTVQRKAGPAVLLTYRADSPPDPVTGKVVHDAVERYEFWHNGTEVTLTLSGPQGADNVDPWRIVTDSLSWQP